MAHTVWLSGPAPYDGAGVLAFLGLRIVRGIEEYEPQAGLYRRSVRWPRGGGVLEARLGDGDVELRLELADARDLDAAVRSCRALLDLDGDPGAVAATLEDDPLIGPLARRAPGLRVPGHVDGHELAIRAVLGQQVSLAAGATLAARIVAAHGTPLERPAGAVTHLFPSAATLAEIDPQTLAMPTSRRRALIGLSAAIASGEIELDADGDVEETYRRLLALPGIGPWTASYIRMRVLRDADAFLPSDLGVRRALERLGQDGSPAAAARLAEAWRPYRACAMLYLWRSLGGG